jgi:glycosyltransferase involved in cell wall biosynthesis
LNATPSPRSAARAQPAQSVCAVIPVFDHERAVGAVLEGIRRAELPCIVVDDGSGPACAAELDRLAAELGAVQLVRLPVNAGKGAAVSAGLEAAAAAGHSHVVQIDADGQHCLEDLPAFLEASRAEPDALICGRPVFDRSVPRSRLYGRYLTHVCVWLNTLSLDIPDAMCGFRVYPLRPTLELLRSVHMGRRMDFDIEVLVRLHWRGQPMRWLDTPVRYPSDGVSHFRLGLDNLLISSVHLRLMLGMLTRLPVLLARRVTGRPANAVSSAGRG